MNTESKNSPDLCTCVNPGFCIHSDAPAPDPLRHVRFAADTECSHRGAPVIQEYSTFFYVDCDLCGERGERDKTPDEIWP